MADPYVEKARRDAELQLADEFDAIASLVEQARVSAEAERRSIEQARQAGIANIYQNARREDYDLMSQMTGSNMGAQSGMRIQGLTDVARARQQAAGQVEASAATSLMNIAEQLNATLNEASRSRQTVARKKTLLIGQLADQYRQQAEMMQLERDKAAADRWYKEQSIAIERERLAAETGSPGLDTLADERQFKDQLYTLSAKLQESLKNKEITADDAWREVQALASVWDRPTNIGTLAVRYRNILPPQLQTSLSIPTTRAQSSGMIGAEPFTATTTTGRNYKVYPPQPNPLYIGNLIDKLDWLWTEPTQEDREQAGAYKPSVQPRRR